MGKLLSVSSLVALLLAAAACTVHQTEVPPLSGPSELAQSVTVTATPDTLPLDGSQSSILVDVRDANGAPMRNVALRLDSSVASSAGCGLAQQNLMTGSDGRAGTVFIAPRLPLALPECSGFNPETIVTIAATPIAGNFQTAVARSASIRMVAPAVIFPPAGPTVNFTISPSSPHVLDIVTFNGTASVPGPGRTLVDYRWDMGDGESKRGSVVTHDFVAATVYVVTLTVTDDIGQQTSKSAILTVQP
jgi:hypothetical protein